MFKFILIALLYAAVARAVGDCNDPNYVPCPANDGSGGGSGGSGGSGGGPAIYQGSGFVLPSPVGSSPVQGGAVDPIQVSGGDDDGGDEKRRRSAAMVERGIYDLTFGSTLVKRDEGLCCQPSPIQCVTATDPTNGDIIPYCYNPATTRCYFLGGDVYFTNNETFIGADGTVADFATGEITYPNGTTGTFSVNSTTATGSAGASPTSTPAPKQNDAVASSLHLGTVAAAVALVIAVAAAV